MIVDDDEDIRALVKMALRSKYEVVCAHDGLDALEKLDRFEPDMVIMDMVMPLMDGLQACQSIRKSPKYHNLHVLFLSAHNSREDVKKAYDSGGNLFLPKPIEPSRLMRNVDMYFEQTPPTYHPKRMSIRQIEMLEAMGKGKESSEATPKPNQPAHPSPIVQTVPPSSPHPVGPTTKVDAEPAPVSSSALVPRILLVEDDKDLSQLITMALSSQFEVVPAYDGLEAVEKVVKYQPDILIIDIMLPKMNGYQLCQSVRSNAAYSKVPIIILTAKSTPKDREYAMRVGANLFLSKPIEMKDLADKCIAITQQPGFQVSPKKITVFDIRTEQVQEEILQKQRAEKLKHIGRELDDIFRLDKT